MSVQHSVETKFRITLKTKLVTFLPIAGLLRKNYLYFIENLHWIKNMCQLPVAIIILRTDLQNSCS